MFSTGFEALPRRFGALRRQRDEGDVGRNDEPLGQVPSRLIEQEHGMCTGRHRGCDLGEVQGHGGEVAVGQHQSRTLARLWADRTKEVGRGGALILWRRGPGTAPGPAPGGFVLLPHPGLVGEPDLYSAGIDALLAGDLLQDGGEGLLKSATAPSAWA